MVAMTSCSSRRKQGCGLGPVGPGARSLNAALMTNVTGITRSSEQQAPSQPLIFFQGQLGVRLQSRRGQERQVGPASGSGAAWAKRAENCACTMGGKSSALGAGEGDQASERGGRVEV